MKHASWIALVMVLTACGGRRAAAPSEPAVATASGGNARAAAASPAAGSNSVIALVDSQPVTSAAMQPLLVEAAGAQILSEIVLDRRIERALAQQKQKLTDADIAAEKDLLMRELSEDRDQSVRLLEQLRNQRGLGPARFDLLLRRNAGLRKLVEGQTQVTEAMVRQAFAQRYGEKKLARLILMPTLPEAGRILQRIGAGESFSDLAVEHSQDVSRAQGGLLPPISPQDDTFPKAVRDVVAQLQPGEVSQPVSLDNGFAILKVERTIGPQAVEYSAVAEDLRRQVRLRLQRALMERQARILLQEAQVTVLDNVLNESWRQRQLELVQPQ